MTNNDYANWQTALNLQFNIQASQWIMFIDPYNGYYLAAFPCSSVSAVPTLSFTFAYYTYTLNNANWMDFVESDGYTYCVPKVIGGISNAENYILLGDPFITSFYIQHDIDNLQIGIIPFPTSVNPLTGSMKANKPL